MYAQIRKVDLLRSTYQVRWCKRVTNRYADAGPLLEIFFQIYPDPKLNVLRGNRSLWITLSFFYFLLGNLISWELEICRKEGKDETTTKNKTKTITRVKYFIRLTTSVAAVTSSIFVAVKALILEIASSNTGARSSVSDIAATKALISRTTYGR